MSLSRTLNGIVFTLISNVEWCPYLDVRGLFNEPNEDGADESFSHIDPHYSNPVFDQVQAENEKFASCCVVFRAEGGVEMFPGHSLQYAHEDGDKSIDVAWIIDTSGC